MTICSKCRKIKGRNCICKPKESFKNIDHSNYALYNSTKWRKFAKRYKAKHPFCVECEKIGITTIAYILDHTKPILQGGAIYDEENLQGLCSKHHNIKSAKDRWKYRKK